MCKVRVIRNLNSVKKAINGSRILFLGVAYKPNIDDARESPVLEIMDIVAKKGGEVSYYDPYIPEVVTPLGREFQSIDSRSFDSSVLQSFDCVVITTKHEVFDAEMIKENAKLIVDLRNVIKEELDNIFKL